MGFHQPQPEFWCGELKTIWKMSILIIHFLVLTDRNLGHCGWTSGYWDFEQHTWTDWDLANGFRWTSICSGYAAGYSEYGYNTIEPVFCLGVFADGYVFTQTDTVLFHSFPYRYRYIYINLIIWYFKHIPTCI